MANSAKKNNFQQFLEETTLHGIKESFDENRSKLIRWIWRLLLLGLFAAFAVGFSQHVSSVMRHPVRSRVNVEPTSSMALPAVTICPLNLVHRDQFITAIWSIISPNMTLGEFRKYMEDYMKDVLDLETDDTFNSTHRILQIDKATTNFLNGYKMANISVSPRELLLGYTMLRAHTKEDSILGCTIHGQKMSPLGVTKKTSANCKNSFTMIKTDVGMCFSLNNKLTHPPLKADSSGAKSGFRIILNAQEEQYMMQDDGYAVGFSVSVHARGIKAPSLNGRGVVVSPGQSTYISVNRAEVNLLPPPAEGSQCTDTEAEEFTNPIADYTHTYTLQQCREICRIKLMTSRCNCTPTISVVPATAEYPSCSSLTRVTCVVAAAEEYRRGSEELEWECGCVFPCSYESFTTSTSSAVFPSRPVLKLYRDRRNWSEEYVRKNLLEIFIFYPTLTYEHVTEELAYRPVDMLSDTGGLLGLCLGASAVTLCELLEFLLAAARRLVRRDVSPHPPTSPTVIHVAPASK